jgi:hypothetical protein
MSTSMTSGRRVRCFGERDVAVAGHADLQSHQLEEQHQALGGVGIVLDDDDVGGPTTVGAAVGAAGSAAPIAAGRVTTNSAPRPGPSLNASTRPVVQLDDLLDQREADAEPAARAVERLLALDE